MKHLICSVLFSIVFSSGPFLQAQESYLFIPAGKLAEIRRGIQSRGSHHQQAFQTMKERVEMKDLRKAYPTGMNKYETCFRAREAAMMALLSQAAERERYADMAFEACQKVLRNGDPSPSRGYGLARSILGMNIAITYNWMQDIWSPSQKAEVLKGIQRALDAWPSYSHANFGSTRGSNWVGVCRGGELVMMVAVNEQEKRSRRFEMLKSHLKQHMQNGYGDKGVSQEGSGYSGYAGQFLLPAVYAAAESGDRSLLDMARKIEWWKLVMFTRSFHPRGAGEGDTKLLQFGVDVRGPDEGWSSLIIPLVPQQQLPYYLWWYDRFTGVHFKPLQDHKGFDAHRAGTTWALLHYPSNVRPQDPTGKMEKILVDKHGYAFFRNRWRDENDIQFMSAGDSHHHSHAWDQPDNLAIRLLANKTSYIAGPGKERASQKNPTTDMYSSLLVKGRFPLSKNTGMTGKLETVEPSPMGGYTIADGGSLYRNMGVSSAKRHCFVLMAHPDTNIGLISTLDQVEGASGKTLVWQANTGAPQSNAGVEESSGTESGRPFFLLKGNNNGYVKGWVLHPADASIKAADPLKIESASQDGRIWVVMMVGTGNPPQARISGQGLNSSWNVGSVTLGYDQGQNRILRR